jgi:hypothetical protein
VARDFTHTSAAVAKQQQHFFTTTTTSVAAVDYWCSMAADYLSALQIGQFQV